METFLIAARCRLKTVDQTFNMLFLPISAISEQVLTHLSNLQKKQNRCKVFRCLNRVENLSKYPRSKKLNILCLINTAKETELGSDLLNIKIKTYKT